MSPATELDGIDLICFDCDGVLWVGDVPIEGAIETLRALVAAGKRCRFVTNNSQMSHAEFEAKARQPTHPPISALPTRSPDPALLPYSHALPIQTPSPSTCSAHDSDAHLHTVPQIGIW